MAGGENTNRPLGGTAALTITLAAVAALAAALPVFRVILLISLPLGVAVAAGLYLWHKLRPVREPKDDSIRLNLK